MMAVTEDKLIAVIIKGSIGLLVLMTTVCWLFFSARAGAGAFVGGCLAITNFFWLRNVLQRILRQLPAKAASYAIFRYVGRLSVNAIALYGILVSGWFSIGGLLAGLSVIVINIIILSLYCASRTGG